MLTQHFIFLASAFNVRPFRLKAFSVVGECFIHEFSMHKNAMYYLEVLDFHTLITNGARYNSIINRCLDKLTNAFYVA